MKLTKSQKMMLLHMISEEISGIPPILDSQRDWYKKIGERMEQQLGVEVDESEEAEIMLVDMSDALLQMADAVLDAELRPDVQTPSSFLVDPPDPKLH